METRSSTRGVSNMKSVAKKKNEKVSGKKTNAKVVVKKKKERVASKNTGNIELISKKKNAKGSTKETKDQVAAKKNNVEVIAKEKNVEPTSKRLKGQQHPFLRNDIRTPCFSDKSPISLNTLCPDILTRHIFPFVGKNHYRFVGAVSRHFRLSYFTVFSTSTAYENVVTMEQAQLCSDDLQNRPVDQVTFCKVMVKQGRQSIAKFLFRMLKQHPPAPGYEKSLTAAAAENGNFELLKWFVRNGSNVHPETFASAATHGDQALFQWLYALQRPYSWDEVSFKKAAKHGHLQILEFVHAKVDRFPLPMDQVCSLAARNGHLHILKWARSMTDHDPWDASTCANAAQNGHLKTLQWLRSQGCPWDESTVLNAAKFGHGEVAQWAKSQGCPCPVVILEEMHEDYENLCDQAARKGNFQMLKIAHTILGLPLSDETSYRAAEHGDLDILKWLNVKGCPWDVQCCEGAALNGHFEVLQWLRAIGCPWFHETMDHAARSGRMDIVQWVHANGCPWSELTCASAAGSGHLKILKWLRANGCPWDGGTYYWAIQYGYLDIVEWAYCNGCPYTNIDEYFCGCTDSLSANICYLAAHFKHLDVLQWARSHNLPWTDRVCVTAASNRDLEMLEWALANCCPWPSPYESLYKAFQMEHDDVLTWFVKKKIGLSTETCARAALEGDYNFFCWLHKNNCPWDETSCANAAKNGHYRILRFARKRGCPSKDVYPIDLEQAAQNHHDDSSASSSSVAYSEYFHDDSSVSSSSVAYSEYFHDDSSASSSVSYSEFITEW